MEQMLHGMVDHADQTQHQYDLDHQGNDPQGRAVLLPFIQFHTQIRNGVPVAVVLRVDPVQLRLKLHHLNGILLNHNAQRQQDQLAQQRKKQNGSPIGPNQLIAAPHQPAQRNSEERVNQRHRYPPNSKAHFGWRFRQAMSFRWDRAPFIRRPIISHSAHNVHTYPPQYHHIFFTISCCSGFFIHFRPLQRQSVWVISVKIPPAGSRNSLRKQKKEKHV